MISSKYIFHFAILLVLMVADFSVGVAQNTETTVPEHKGELIFLELEINQELRFDIDARMVNEELYLAASQFLSRLQIKTSTLEDEKELTVFYPDPDNPTKVQLSNWIENEDYIRDEYYLYIHKDHLEQILDLELMYDFRQLSLFVFTDGILPVVAINERKKRYQNFIPRSVEFTPEITRPAGHHLLNGWVADWALNNNINSTNSNYSYNLGIGGQILGGNISMYGSGSKAYGLHTDRLRGRWELPVFSSPFLKQFQAGFLSHKNSVGLSKRSFRGISLTNTPHAPRQNFNIFNHTGLLEQGWDAELYVNNRLRNFVTGDEATSYQFSTPLQYGSNLIQLNYYDPNGIVQQRDHMIYVPHKFLPSGAFEYTLSGGRYNSIDGVDFGRLNMQLGLSPQVTIGGGALAEFSKGRRKLFPFVQSWMRLGNSVIAEGSHTYSRLSEGALQVRFSGSQSLLMDIKKYHHNQLIEGSSFNPGLTDNYIHFNKAGKSLETSLNTSFPVDFSFLDLSAFLTSRYIRYFSGNQNMSLYSGFSTRLPFGLHTRIKNRLMLRNEQIRQLTPSQMNTEVQLSRRMFRKLLLRPSLTFNHRLKSISNIGLQMNVRLTSRSYLNFSFQRDNLHRNNRFLVSFKLDLPFARHTSYVRSGVGNSTLNQATSGSIAFNNQSSSLHFNDQNNMGKAGLVLDPFLDLNDNGQKDSGEPPVEGISAKIYRPGSDSPSYQGTKVVENLIPYEKYFIKVNDLKINNPLWKLKHSSYSVQVLPNMVTPVPIPVMVTGEMAGKVNTVYSGTSPVNGLEIKVTDLSSNFSSSDNETTGPSAASDNSFTTTLTTYTGGQFYYVGLMPGRYKAVLNADQLAKRSLVGVRDSLEFTIEAVQEGDIVEDLEFQVHSLSDSDSQQVHIDSVDGSLSGTSPREQQRISSNEQLTQESPQQSLQIKYPGKQASASYFAIQVGAFKSKRNAESFSRNPEMKHHQDVTIFYDAEDRLYKCVIGKFLEDERAWQTLIQLVAENSDTYRYSFIVELP